MEILLGEERWWSVGSIRQESESWSVRKSNLEIGKKKSYRRDEESGRDSLRREREEFTTELAEGPQSAWRRKERLRR
jgi:hypothetical protein